MRAVFLIVIFAILMFRGVPLMGALLLAVLLTVALSVVLAALARATVKGRRPHPADAHEPVSSAQANRKKRRKRAAPSVKDGDIGPAVRHMLERGETDAAIRCIEEHVPGSWGVRGDIIAMVEEHGRLQRSLRIARLAGVPMPDEAATVAAEQIDLIADRARRMAFIHMHGTMNPRIEASLGKLVAGKEPLIAQSATLRAELAESTANPQWGEHEERELLRTLERMSNTLQAMNSELATNELDGIAELDHAPVLEPGLPAKPQSAHG